MKHAKLFCQQELVSTLHTVNGETARSLPNQDDDFRG